MSSLAPVPPLLSLIVSSFIVDAAMSKVFDAILIYSKAFALATLCSSYEKPPTFAAVFIDISSFSYDNTPITPRFGKLSFSRVPAEGTATLPAIPDDSWTCSWIVLS